MTLKPESFLRSPLGLIAILGSVIALLLVALVALMVTDPGHAHEKFPAEVLRVEEKPPTFQFINQDGDEVSLESLRGKAVMITGVFATCHTACPTIIAEAKEAVTELRPEQREKVAIVAITLDPEGDTQEKRKATADAHALDAPLFHYVNADDPSEVDRVLDELGFVRGELDRETGVMAHANMFVLLDPTGSIAYKLTLGSSRHHWIAEALAILADEA